MYQIEKNIPVPDRLYRGGKKGQFPWHEMADGDSFFIGGVSDKRVASICGSAYRLLTPKGLKPLRRPEGDGFRIWAVKS